MMSRIQNRNPGYSENLFSHNPRVDNNTLNSIDGATALKLDESFEVKEEVKNNIVNETTSNLDESLIKTAQPETHYDEVTSGISIESASYIEKNNLEDNNEFISETNQNNNEEEYTPKLFSEERSYESNDVDVDKNDKDENESDLLFDQDLNEEEDFEIPAFLRKQKF